MTEKNQGNTKKRPLSSPDATDPLVPEKVKITSLKPSSNGPTKDEKTKEGDHGKHKVKAAKMVDDPTIINDDSSQPSKSTKTSTKNIITVASSGLTTSTQRIGLKSADESSSPSPTKPSSSNKSEQILSLPDPSIVAALKTNSAIPPSSFNGNFSTLTSTSGFVKFSSAPLASFSSTNPDPSPALSTPFTDKQSPLLSSPVKSASASTFSFGSGKGTFGSGSATFGSGKGTFGSGSATFGSTGGTSSVFGSKNKTEKEEDEEEGDGEEDGHQGYLEEQKKKYEIQEVVTGEEGEELVANARCKLFVEDPGTVLSLKTEEESKNNTSSSSTGWKERGVGIVKLSKMSDGKHRLVMRSDIVRKVILNIMIHPGMPIYVRNERYIEFYAAGDSSLVNYINSGAKKEDKSIGLVKYLMRCKNRDVAEDFCASVTEIIPPVSKGKPKSKNVSS